MDSAPSENPASVSSTIVMSLVLVQTPPSINIRKNIMKNNERPNTASPATPSPMTVPPPKEIFSASGRLVFAACVVRTFVLVAIRIPIFPAKAENTAPITKAMIIR